MSDGLPSEDELESGTVVAAPLEAHDLPPDFLPRPAAVGLRPFLGQTTSAGANYDQLKLQGLFFCSFRTTTF